VQNLADLIRSTFSFQEVLRFYRDEFGRHVESIRDALHDEHRLQLQQAQEENQLLVGDLQSELEALWISFDVRLKEAQATNKKLKQSAQTQKRLMLPKAMMEEYKKRKVRKSITNVRP
jgi:GAF domain-containing protein